MIHEMLSEGAENAKTAGELEDVLRMTRREITRAVERERRDGWPICASCTAPRGYYLASTQGEMQAYCHSLEHRQNEVGRTLKACLASMKDLPPGLLKES